jgi:hypothetical protein
MTTALVILSIAIAVCGTLCACKLLDIRIRIDVETHVYTRQIEDCMRFGDDDNDDDDGDAWKKKPWPVPDSWSDIGRG